MNTTTQVKSVLDDMISKVVKHQRRVTWLPAGIKSVRTFVPEPWRRVTRKPISYIREANIEEAVPFILPPEVLTCKPILDDPILSEAPQVFRGVVQCGVVPLPRTIQVSLDEVYKIAKQLNKIKDMDRFIEDTSVELQHGVKKINNLNS
tara:strand:+ start:1811 stop:2257 length:447 start_codon:yes stop_codon:yes gene_type:complete